MSANIIPSKNAASKTVIREAIPSDLDFLEQLEIDSFIGHRQSSRSSIQNSMSSPHQVVYVIEINQGRGRKVLAGSAIIILYKRALRIYSLAVHQDFRMSGLGELLIQKIVELSVKNGYEKISLEADDSNTGLINWYRKLGFEITHFLPDYYKEGESAYRMTRKIDENGIHAERVVIVVDEEHADDLNIPGAKICAAKDYLANGKYSNSSRFHILNLCKSYKTHSMGYYVSLLASARNHRITPSVMTVKDISSTSIAQSIIEEIDEFIREKLKQIKEESFELTVILGKTPQSQYADLAKKLFSLFEIPFFSVVLERKGDWRLKKINVLALKALRESYPVCLQEALTSYCEKKRYFRARLKSYKYDLAILVNHQEKTPPSCPLALEKFRKAAEKVGFFVEFITKQDHRRLCEFDALFIRETTAIESHTYAMARHAYTEGLVVIDDPWSILLCSNKVYLQERLANAGVSQPKGLLLTKRICTPAYLASLPYPLVLKLPESSFSQGVFRANNLEEIQARLKEMFSESALVIAQEFMVSDYDWRIGVLDHKPLFACKYFMAQGHWQIYNWQSVVEDDITGRCETLPVSEVPAYIIKAAIKATTLIGNGLYGVDLKEINGKAYVIEVNDNPNIDDGIEDLVLGDELYNRVMQSIYYRIEVERMQTRPLT
ncbi:MAG: GNAT family N-acetyltransferase [Kiritimatiellia bacterium]